MILAGCIATVACLGWRVRQTVLQPATAAPDRGQAVVGYFLANQVLAELGDQQGRIVLFFPPTSVLDEEAVGTYAGTFRRVLRGFPDLKVDVLTLTVPAKAAKAGQFPLSAFQQAGSNVAALAYVSFTGVPKEIESFRTGAADKPLRFYVFDPWATTNWLAALEKGIIRRVIVPRPGVRAGTEISGDPNDVFNQLYLLATPETATRIAGQLVR